MTIELPWIAQARKYIGLVEDTSKTSHDPTLLAMLKSMGSFNGESRAWWNEDETPWCGLFVGYCLGSAGCFVIREWYRASAWNDPDQLTRLDKPAYGCLATFTRTGGGHVGFVVGRDKHGNLMVLGGNQQNAVSIAPFDPQRVTGYFWPSSKTGKMSPEASGYTLPVLSSSGAVSTNEA